MVLRQLIAGTLVGLFAVGLALTAPTQVRAQLGAAGVIVDPDNVLRTKTYQDPTGQLTRQRLAQARAALAPDLARPSACRKISINRLEAALAEQLDHGGGVTEPMRFLAGLTRVRYVFYYPQTRDIVIAGPAEGFGLDLSGRAVGLTSGHAVLELQDLVVALRAYAPGSNPTRMIGCSIDPTQEGLARMQQFLVRISGRVTPGDAQNIANGLRENLGLQTVTVHGVSPETHFAQVLVEADYRMKLIGIGLETPPVKIASYVQKANPAAVARNALQRWYFVPDYDKVRVSEDTLAMELVGEGVKLIGDDERVQADGSRIRARRIDRASQLFTTSFTKKYPELARKSPVYAQLRNLIDMSIATAFIQQQDYYAKADWRMELFASEEHFSVETYQAPKQVETAVNAIWKGRTLMTPVGGGVDIRPRRALASDKLLSDDDGKLQQLYEQTEIKNLAKGQWWWD